ncbi:MAG TPA: hypothetical protein PKB15_00410 [Acidimicrobiia bacterium]|nr:hypothetical protein [Acidimicrobiia bacterium]
MTILTFHPTRTHADATSSFFGYDPYIEVFWLPAVGPTATWLINSLCLRALIAPDTFSLAASELSACAGTGMREGHSSPVHKQLTRLCQVGIFHEINDDEYLVPQSIDPFTSYRARKLTDPQRSVHDQWMQRLHVSPLETQRRRAQYLLTRLETIGLSESTIHSTLHGTGLHPSIIGEAIAGHTSRQNSAA